VFQRRSSMEVLKAFLMVVGSRRTSIKICLGQVQ
jgi:hypothetical protein